MEGMSLIPPWASFSLLINELKGPPRTLELSSMTAGCSILPALGP